MSSSHTDIIPARLFNNKIIVFFSYWIILFIIYLPAAQAGRVGDFPGWVHFLNSVNFTKYINRSGSGIPSMYQFTQVVSYIFYQAFGANAWLWHLLYITLQSLNTLLLFTFFSLLFYDSSVKNATLAAFTGGLLFCLCPHISEVVVWESSFHYLLGLLLMLMVLHCVQKFIITQKTDYAWLGGIVFFLSTYSLEVFYLTPLFVISLAFYYHSVLQHGKPVIKKVLRYFTLPQLIFFTIHFILLRTLYHQGIAHIGSVAIQLNVTIFSKPLKYIFHILFFGRFFNDHVRSSVYHFCESGMGLSLFYGLLALILIYFIAGYNKFNNSRKAIVLLFTWAALAIGLILPLWFPDSGLVIYDRYTYLPDAFIYMFLALLLNNFCRKQVYIALMFFYALLNYRFTHRVNAYWQQSAEVVNNLVATFPNDPSKKVLLLNLPECLDGVQMVGTRDDGEFRMMYNAIMPDKISNDVYDAEAFYMRSPIDGAHVSVIDDTTIRVTLNQWGTWWVYYGYGASSYENSDYKVIMRDPGHWYDLVLKHPASEYLLLFSVGKDWRKVDLSKKGSDQN